MKTLLSTLGALVFALTLGAFIVVLAGESPATLLEALVISLSAEGLGYTLFYTTPLILTGLSVSLSFHCGLFNIGSEGQLYVGSLAIIAIATAFPHAPEPAAIAGGVLVACVAGGAWGGIAGALKGLKGSHEVIVTILLNFIGFALVDYAILYLFKDIESQSAETLLVPAQFQLPTLDAIASTWGVSFFRSTPVNITLFGALSCAALMWVFLYRTRTGYEFRAVGHNPSAARFAGIPIGRTLFFALALSGALSGLVGVNEIMGHQHRLIQGFSPGYGFTGIAVALLGRNHPLAVVLSAFLFGLLHNMSREIEFLTTHISKEIALVIQAVLIALIAVDFRGSLRKRGRL